MSQPWQLHAPLPGGTSPLRKYRWTETRCVFRFTQGLGAHSGKTTLCCATTLGSRAGAACAYPSGTHSLRSRRRVERGRNFRSHPGTYWLGTFLLALRDCCRDPCADWASECSERVDHSEASMDRYLNDPVERASIYSRPSRGRCGLLEHASLT